MQGPDLRGALGRLRISQMELARRLKVAPSTVRRWIAGTSPIPEAVALLLAEWLRANPKRRSRTGRRPSVAA